MQESDKEVVIDTASAQGEAIAQILPSSSAETEDAIINHLDEEEKLDSQMKSSISQQSITSVASNYSVASVVGKEEKKQYGLLSSCGVDYHVHVPKTSHRFPSLFHGFHNWNHNLQNIFRRKLKKKLKQDEKTRKANSIHHVELEMPEPGDELKHHDTGLHLEDHVIEDQQLHDEAELHIEGKLLAEPSASDSVKTYLEKAGVKPIPNIAVRIFVLILIFFVAFGTATGYSSVAAVGELVVKNYNLSDNQYSLLFSIYALPNIATVYLSGIMADKIGTHITLFICLLFFMGGHLITLGNTYHFLLIGRMLYGIGSECVGTISSKILARWFTFDTVVPLGFSNSIFFVSYRLSSFLIMFLITPLGMQVGLFPSLLIFNALNASSAVAIVLLYIMDRIYAKYLDTLDSYQLAIQREQLKKESKGDSPSEPPSDSKVKRFLINAWRGATEVFRLPLIFWMTAILTFFFYGGTLTFVSFGPQFIQEYWKYSTEVSSVVTGLIYGVACLVLIPSGIFVDRFGHRLSMMIVSSVVVVIGYILLLFVPKLTPWVGGSLLGINYGTMPSGIFPLIPLVCEPNQIGVAYGLLDGLAGLAQFLVPFGIGYISSMWYKGLVCMVCCIIMLIGSFIILLYDRIASHGKVELTCVKTTATKKSNKQPVVE